MTKEGSPEDHTRETDRSAEPLAPFELPPELAALLADQRYACVTQASTHGTVLVVKAPGRDIERLRGPVPIQQRQDLYEHPAAPVIRPVTTLYDHPDRPLKLGTFINVADAQQRADFAALATQDEVLLLFYDEALQHRLTKGVAMVAPERSAALLEQAEHLRAAIPAERFDFDRAKADVMRATTL